MESSFDEKKKNEGSWSGGRGGKLAPPTWLPAECRLASFHAERGLCSRWGALLISCEPALNMNDLTLSRMYNSASFILIYPTAGHCRLEYLRLSSHYLGSVSRPSVTIKARRRWFIKKTPSFTTSFTLKPATLDKTLSGSLKFWGSFHKNR